MDLTTTSYLKVLRSSRDLPWGLGRAWDRRRAVDDAWAGSSRCSAADEASSGCGDLDESSKWMERFLWEKPGKIECEGSFICFRSGRFWLMHLSNMSWILLCLSQIIPGHASGAVIFTISLSLTTSWPFQPHFWFWSAFLATFLCIVNVFSVIAYISIRRHQIWDD